MISFLIIQPLSIILVGYRCNSKNGRKANKISDENNTLNRSVNRFGSKPKMLKKYKELSANPWPGVLEQIIKKHYLLLFEFLEERLSVQLF